MHGLVYNMSNYSFVFSFIVHLITANINNIPVRTSTNFTQWKKYVMVVLGFIDLDIQARLSYTSDQCKHC